MPKRQDIKKILLVGSGPIVIGQACEFDYSGTQGAKALKEEGFEVILVNSNPATIMTDPEFSHRTYIEPLVPEILEKIIEVEKPDALLPTLGGQTALNLALALHHKGILKKHGVELLGASIEAIHKAEDRERFKQAMLKIGLSVPRAFTVKTIEEADHAVSEIGFPIILRPSFTMGGSGGGIAYNKEEFDASIRWAFQQSPTHECLVEQSVLGWKEYELEVIRDTADNFAVICSIENFDPMGVHTGDSITVAPAMTLTDKEYQIMRDAAKAIIREIGVETGGANIQFAVNPTNGDMIVIEMNPRVSRSSALASKATGYPIAKIAAKLAVGYRLDELKNDITKTSSAFEPTMDYVVVKVPRFAFEKFRGADPRLTTQMKSVGESLSMGRNFKEALQKATRSLEIGRAGLTTLLNKVNYIELARRVQMMRDSVPSITTALPSTDINWIDNDEKDEQHIKRAILEIIATPLADRLWYILDGMRLGLTQEDIHKATKIDPWFLRQLEDIVREESEIAKATIWNAEQWKKVKSFGFSDAYVAQLRNLGVDTVRSEREMVGVMPTYHRVDTCAGEFLAHTPYFYGTYSNHCEALPTDKKKIMILGGGPNRIGQGIEFDYCCVHASYALRELGYETIMVNCNPETVSTDFDTSDRLYFEPLTYEDVLAIVHKEKPHGVIVQYGGQTPLKLAKSLERAGVPIIGTSADSIDRAEDRERFDEILTKLNLRRPKGGIAKGMSGALRIAQDIGYPLVVRPSYVLGGRAMEVVYSQADLTRYFAVALEALSDSESQTILLDEFLRDAIEVDVDCICDGETVVIGGILQHIEEAGVHSGDSSMVLPAHALPSEVLATIRSSTRSLALELGVKGLMNVQYAIRGSAVYILEVNPRASRTIPFVSKAIGIPLAKLGAKVMAGKTLKELGFTKEKTPKLTFVKESVFPFAKFPGVDIILGPEMRSTGEVMGIGRDLPEAFLKAQLGSNTRLPMSGKVFMSVRNDDKPAASELARRLVDQGYEIVATQGTADVFERSNVKVTRVNKVMEGRPHIVDHLRNNEIAMVVNTTEGEQAIRDSYSLRRQTVFSLVPYFTTIAAAAAVVDAIEQQREKPDLRVKALQDIHAL